MPDLKKYVIEYGGGSNYHIMEVIEISIHGVKLKNLYYTTDIIDYLIEQKETYIYTLKDIKDNIIYTAETIKECEDMLPIIKSSKKYNIV